MGSDTSPAKLSQLSSRPPLPLRPSLVNSGSKKASPNQVPCQMMTEDDFNFKILKLFNAQAKSAEKKLPEGQSLAQEGNPAEDESPNKFSSVRPFPDGDLTGEKEESKDED